MSTERTSPDDAWTLFLRPVSAIWQTYRTGSPETASGAASDAPLSPFFNLALRPNLTQPSSIFKDTQINTSGTGMSDLSQTLKFLQIFGLRLSSFYENSREKSPRSIIWP